MTRLLPQFSHSHSCPPNAGVLHLTMAFNALHCSTVNRCIFLYSDTNRRTIFAIIPASTSTLQFTTPALLFLQPKIVFFFRHSHPLAAGPQGASLNAEARHWLASRAASSQLKVQVSSRVSNRSGNSQLSCADWLDIPAVMKASDPFATAESMVPNGELPCSGAVACIPRNTVAHQLPQRTE